jgi:hypothetical protein
MSVVNLSLDHVHCKAICDEIGRSELTDTPAYLSDLLNRFQELELRESPSIVPALHQLSDGSDVALQPPVEKPKAVGASMRSRSRTAIYYPARVACV